VQQCLHRRPPKNRASRMASWDRSARPEGYNSLSAQLEQVRIVGEELGLLLDGLHRADDNLRADLTFHPGAVSGLFGSVGRASQ